MTQAPCAIRPVLYAGRKVRAKEHDAEVGFVIKAWLDSFQYADAAGPLPMDLYFQAYRETVKRLLGWPGVDLALATHHDDADMFFGFMAWMRPGRHEHRHEMCGAPVLLYIYVKEPYRRLGVAKALLEHAGIDPSKAFCFPFKAPMWGEWGRKKWTGGHFRPLTFRFPLAQETTS